MPYSGATASARAMSMWQLTFRSAPAVRQSAAASKACLAVECVVGGACSATEEEAKALSAAGLGALKAEALRRCGRWHVPVPQLLERTEATLVTGYPVYDHEPLATGAPGGGVLPGASVVTLCGDAAHRRAIATLCAGRREHRHAVWGGARRSMSPLKGQGANQALLDALSVADRLRWALLPGTRCVRVGRWTGTSYNRAYWL